jgi:eukaryotic-like serine/threonine-protein kinase
MISKLAKIAVLFVAFLVVAGASAYLTLTFIIKSEDTVIVPDLVGKDVATALERLTDLQLNTKVNGSEYSRQFPKNHITYQEPGPGSEIKKDRDIRIIISKGPKNILMPNLISLSERQARMIMEENGISQGHLTHTYFKAVEKDNIIVQVPSAGTMITRGASVDLLVSMGSRPVAYKMPVLIGLSLDKAVLTIEKTNLTVGEIKSHFDKHKSLNIVIRQEPPAGYRIRENSPVSLVINRHPGKTAGAHLNHSLYGSLLQHQVKNGFLKKRIRVELESEDRTVDIFDDYIKPGEEMWVLVPRDRDARAFIFEDDKLVDTQLYEAW